MSSGSLPFTLLGFAAELDWRQIWFVRPIPENRICSACRLVCRITALLPCRHVLCECCHQQCEQDAGRVCPLDGRLCPEDAVILSECRSEEILTKEVTCWNKASGCRAVVPASDIFRHFHRECDYHWVSCSNCSRTIRRGNVCRHLRSSCQELITPLAFEIAVQASDRDKALLLSIKQALEEHANEVRAFLERLSVSASPSDETLTEITHGVNAVRETLNREVIDTTNALKEWLWETVEYVRKNQDLACQINTVCDTLKTQFGIVANENTERLLQAISAVGKYTSEGEQTSRRTLERTENVLRLTEMRTNSIVFLVKNVKSCYEAAVEVGRDGYFFKEKVYLCGYCIEPGLKFKKAGDSVSIHASFSLLQGCVDEAVPWPFRLRIKLSFIHQVNDVVCAAVLEPTPETGRPQASEFTVVELKVPSLTLDGLFRDGYVHNNDLLVKWELLE